MTTNMFETWNKLHMPRTWIVPIYVTCECILDINVTMIIKKSLFSIKIC